VLIAGYIYKAVHLVLYSKDGLGIQGFVLANFILKYIGEAISTTMLIALSWGWSLTNLKSNRGYIAIGIVVGLINIYSLVVSATQD